MIDVYYYFWDLNVVYYFWLMVQGVECFFGDFFFIQCDYLIDEF